MDLTKLMKGPAEAEPVQEQPKLSKEEYAAQKKAEREEGPGRIRVSFKTVQVQ